MKLPRLRLTVRRMMVTIAVISVVLGVGVIALRPRVNRVVVVNRSGRIISRLLLSVSGEKVVFRNVADGSTVSAPFPSHGLDEFAVNGSLSGGTALRGGFGFRTDAKRSSYPEFVIGKNGALMITEGR